MNDSVQDHKLSVRVFFERAPGTASAIRTHTRLLWLAPARGPHTRTLLPIGGGFSFTGENHANQ